MDFSKLSFGSPAAERDQGLKEYFVASKAYERVASGEKTIILGNRGSGKSAIFRFIAENERKHGTLVIDLSPNEYSYEILSDMMLSEQEGSWAKQSAYSVAWQYLIWVLIMKRLSERGPKIKRGATAKVYNYLRDNHYGTQDNPISILISYLKRIEGFKVGNIEGNIKKKELIKLYQLEEINELIPSIIEMCRQQKVLVLVDELDRGWDASEDAKSFVSGLFQAAISINRHTDRLQVLVSLRQELYENIPSLYEDAQKVRDIIEVISWDEPSLLELIAKRIKYFVPELEQRNNIEVWNAIFEETLDYRQTKSFKYIVDRTLYRPREIIQFCTDIINNTTRQTSLFSEKQWTINYSLISEAELRYSRDRAVDIAAEYRFQYPGMMSLFEVFRGMYYTFDREELELICLGIIDGDYHVDKATELWSKDSDPEYLINILWKVGFLKAQAVGGVKTLSRHGSKFLGSYQIQYLNLKNITRFHIHPIFRAFLGLREQKK